MRAISFGRLNVQDHGVPVKMGQSFLAANMTAADETLTVNSASPFCQDMVPFKMDIDPTGDLETVVVKSMSGPTFVVQRGMFDTTPVAHGSGAVVMAKFPFAGWNLSVVAGLTEKMYWGKNNMVAGSTGVIHEFWPNILGDVDDQQSFMADGGNPLNLTDYAMDAEVDGEGMFVTLWER